MQDSSNIPEYIQHGFQTHAIDLLTNFRFTAGQCLAVNAYISKGLTESKIEHSIIIGSLYCLNIPAYEYNGPVPDTLNNLSEWEGHAWIEFENIHRFLELPNFEGLTAC